MSLFTEIDLTQLHSPTRLALAQFELAMANLLLAYGIEPGLMDDLAVNFDGFSKRLDVARLDATGHLARIVLSLQADPNAPDTFGAALMAAVQKKSGLVFSH